MEANRLQELNFLIRTDTPVPMTESRSNAVFDDELYNDFYTIKELIEEGYLEYVGKDKNYQLFLRPKANFSIYVVESICELKSGEIVTIALTKAGHTEFHEWIESRNSLT